MLLRAILISATCCCGGNAIADAALVIDNARAIVGDGTVKDNVCVTIREGRIQSVQEVSPQVGTDARIDARGMTVLPGLIDVHVHVLWPSATVDGGCGEKAFRQDFVADLPVRLKEFVRHGVTTIKSTGEMFAMALELRERKMGSSTFVPVECTECVSGSATRA